MRFIILPVVLAAINLLSGSEIVNLWSDREIVMPGTGKWVLTAPHGRILASGNGEARFLIPALANSTTSDAALIRNNKKQMLRFHSPKPLTDINAGMLELPEKQKRALIRMGMPSPSKDRPEIWFCGSFPPDDIGRIFLVFPDRRDFPMNIGNVYDEILLIRAKKHGRLSVLYDKKEQALDLNGAFSCAVLRKGKKTTVVFSPELDLDEIENILLIKQILKEESKK